MNNVKDFSEATIILYSQYNRIDIDKAFALFKNLIKYYSSKKSDRLLSNPLLSLQERWYESLDNGFPDYGVYSDDYYFIDLMACYWIYSKNYISCLKKNVFDNKTKNLVTKYNNISSIYDLGCGLGHTTNDLKQMFTDSEVYCSNIVNTPQWYYCEENLIETINLIDGNENLNRHIDLVFASEFFEHIINPIEYLEKIINDNTPDIFIIANSFNTKSIGHFRVYKNDNVDIDQAKISKLFNNVLRSNGYIKEKTAIWNDKPSIWKRIK